jgi:DNA-binding NarL/FixJ family response regulator
MDKIPVFIVDDQNLFRQSLALVINSVDQFELLGDFENGKVFLKQLTGLIENRVYVAIIDMDMPGMNGIELNKVLHDLYPQVRVIILSVHINPSLISQMVEARAAAYLAKNCDMDELIAAIQSVHKSGFYFNRTVLKAIQTNANSKIKTEKSFKDLAIDLSERDKQIIKLICMEYNNVEISKELYISPRTVEGRRITILNKIGCRNTAGMVLFAIKHGLFKAPK